MLTPTLIFYQLKGFTVISKFLIQAYDSMTEVCLWLTFLGAGLVGYASNGIVGLAVGLGAAFIFSVFAVAPLMMFSEMRKSLIRLENMAAQSTKPALERKSHQNQGGGTRTHVKNYKGFEITRANGKFYVNEREFMGVISAETWIDEHLKSI